ncbi:unnamed protein product [Effrenium voratum]|uniref:Uncharacterized protein n=1 Tax=Effrenium voratum TaxID=2562239 RepID=A0AA36N0C1_9DINO|nr:unnamed protein product [Effrenium voratum]
MGGAWAVLAVLPLLQTAAVIPGNKACRKARIISIGARVPDSAWLGLYLEDRPISFSPSAGVNIIALDPGTQEVLSAEAYGPGQGPRLKQDLLRLELGTVVLAALKGDVEEDHLQALRVIQAALVPLVSPGQGYAMVGAKGMAPWEELGSTADVEAYIPCTVTPHLESQLWARKAAKAAGADPEKVGAAVAAEGYVGAVAAARHVAELASQRQAPQQVASTALRAALAAGASGPQAWQAAAEQAAAAVAFSSSLRGAHPSEVGTNALRAASALAGLGKHQAVLFATDAAQKAVEDVLRLSGESEEVLRAARRLAADGVIEGEEGQRLEGISEWLHPETKIDFMNSGRRAAEVLARLSSEASPAQASPTLSKAAAAKAAAARAATEGGSPELIVKETKKAAKAFGAHEAAAAHLAAKFGLAAALFQAQTRFKSPARMGADAKAVLEASGLRDKKAWALEEERLARSVAAYAADSLQPHQVGKAVAQALRVFGAHGGQLQLAAKEAAETMANHAARSNASLQTVASSAREAAIGSGLKDSASISRIAGHAAAWAVARQTARSQAGWQEVAEHTAAAAEAALLPKDQVPWLVARAAGLEVAKATARSTKSGEQVGLAVAAAVQAAGVAKLSPVIAGEVVASALASESHGFGLSMRDVTDAARAAGAPSALRLAAQMAASDAAEQSARRGGGPAEVAEAAVRAISGAGLSKTQVSSIAARVAEQRLTWMAAQKGGGNAPLDLARAVQEALATIGVDKALAARRAAKAGASCAVKVSIARNESAKDVGSFAVMVAQAAGVQETVAQAIAANTVAKDVAESWAGANTSTLVEHVKAAVLATGLPKEQAVALIAKACGEAVADHDALPAIIGSAARAATAAAGLGVAGGVAEGSAELSGRLAAAAAARRAVHRGAWPSEVLGVASEAATAAGAPSTAKAAAADAVAQLAAKSGAAAWRVGMQAKAASGDPEIASHAAAKAMAQLVVPASVPEGAKLVQEAAQAAGVGPAAAAQAAAAAMARASAEEAIGEGASAAEVGSVAFAAGEAAGLSKTAAEAVACRQAELALQSQQDRQGDAAFRQEVVDSIHAVANQAPVDVTAWPGTLAESFVYSGGSSPEQCNGRWQGLGLKLQPELAAVAAAVAKASAASRIQPGSWLHFGLGSDTECATAAAARSRGKALPHAAFLAARSAALAAATRVADLGGAAPDIGVAALRAAEGSSVPREVAAEVASQAAAVAGARRAESAGAVVAALRGAGHCPGHKAVLGAMQAARAVGQSCHLRAVSASECGVQAHMAAGQVLAACQIQITHYAKQLAAEAVAAAEAEQLAGVGGDPMAVATFARQAAAAAGASASLARGIASQQACRAVAEAEASSKSPEEVGQAAKAAAESASSGALDLALREAVRAVVGHNAAQHNSVSLMAEEAQLAAGAVGLRSSASVCEHAVGALADHKASTGSGAKEVGEAAKHLALALAIAPPTSMSGASQNKLSLQTAVNAAAKAAARAVIKSSMAQRYGTPELMKLMVRQAQQAAQGTGAPLDGTALAAVLGRAVAAEGLRRGETMTSTGQMLQAAVQELGAHRAPGDVEELRAAAGAAAADEVALSSAGLPPAVLRERCRTVLKGLVPPDLSSILASRSAVAAVAVAAQPGSVGLARQAMAWQLQKARPAAAKVAAQKVADALAGSLSPALLSEAARHAAFQLGLSGRSAARLGMAAAARSAAQRRAEQGASPAEIGAAAREAVLAGLEGDRIGLDLDGRAAHALLSTAVPAAVKASLANAGGAAGPAGLAERARGAAEGAIGKDVNPAFWGDVTSEAADLVATEAAKAAVLQGQLPFQATSQAKKAAAAIRSSSPITAIHDGMAAARAILQHGLSVSADVRDTAQLARVAAESAGLRIEEARHKVAEQLSSMLANEEANFMSLQPSADQTVAKKALVGSMAAGCQGAEAAWIASHAATAAVSKAAAERGADVEDIARVALAAARGAGSEEMEAQKIAAWSAAKSAGEQVLSLGATAVEAGRTALQAAHAVGLGVGAKRLAAEAAAKAVLDQARRDGGSHVEIAQSCKAAASATGLEDSASSLLAASFVCPKAAEAAATTQLLPQRIGMAARAAAEAAGANNAQGAEEAGVAAASAAVQSAMAGNVNPAAVAAAAQEAWASAGAAGKEVSPGIAAIAVLKRLARHSGSVPKHLGKAAKAIADVSPPQIADKLTGILVRVVAESSARRGGRPDEVAHNVLEALRVSHSKLPEGETKKLAAAVAANQAAQAAAEQGEEPASVSAAAAKAAVAVGLPENEVKDLACTAAAAGIAQHSTLTRQPAAVVADQVLQATSAAGCEDQKGLTAAIAAASRNAAKASLALHGASPTSVAKATWRAATQVLAHVGRHDSALWADLVSVEAASAWQAQALVSGFRAHAEQGVSSIKQAMKEVSEEERRSVSTSWLLGDRSGPFLALVVLVCLAGLFGWSDARKKATSAVRGVLGIDDQRDVQKFCCAQPAQDRVYSAVSKAEAGQEQLESDDEPTRHNTAAHSWFDGEDRFAEPPKLVVVLERAALERSRELVGRRANG